MGVRVEFGRRFKPLLAGRVKHPDFPHKRNRDNTFDSICLKCFQTIARSSNEGDLKVVEDAHACPGIDLGRILYPAVS